MQHPFEYFALRYLLLWEQSDRQIHDLMQGDPTPKRLRKILHDYGVARTFKGMDDEKAGMILTSMKKIEGTAKEFPIQSVEFLVSEFKVFSQSNLSAATKLLWFRYRHPYVILDKQAKTGLKKLGYKFNPQKYSQYEKAWRAAFNQRKDEICAAVAHLPTLQRFFPNTQIEQLVNEQWFQERVFDIYLWELGTPNKPLQD